MVVSFNPPDKRFLDKDSGETVTAYGLVYIPVDATPSKPLDLIVAVHGGPNGGVTERYDAYNLFAQFLTSRGWVVFAPNYRGCFCSSR